MNLEWKRTGTHEMKTACLQYKINKFMPDHARPGAQALYQAWKRKLHDGYLRLGAWVDSFTEARQLCEEDAAA